MQHRWQTLKREAVKVAISGGSFTLILATLIGLDMVWPIKEYPQPWIVGLFLAAVLVPMAIMGTVFLWSRHH